MNVYRVLLPPLLGCVLLLSACGGDEGDKVAFGATGGVTGNNSGLESGLIDGVWKSTCVSYESSDSVYTISEIWIAEPEFETTVRFYSENTCEINAVAEGSVPAQTVVIRGVMTQTEGSVSTSLGEAALIDIVTETIAFDGVPAPVGVYPKGTEYDIGLVSDGSLYTGKISDKNSGDENDNRPLILDLANAYALE